MTDKWRYKNTAPFAYGNNTSYTRAARWLDLPGEVVEDWGCGGGWARQFFRQARYVGLDGSRSHFCDRQVDFQEYVSSVDGVLVRHVLEHNHNWQAILRNAVESFQHRMVLVLFMPFSQGAVQPTHENAASNENVAYDGGIPNLCLNHDEVVSAFKPFLVKEESLPETGEHIFYLSKRGELYDEVQGQPNHTGPA